MLLYCNSVIQNNPEKNVSTGMHCRKGNRFSDILCGIFRVVSRFPVHFGLYLGNLDYFLALLRSRHFFKRIRLQFRTSEDPELTSAPASTKLGRSD